MSSILTRPSQESKLTISSDLSFTKANMLSKDLILLSNPLQVKKIECKAKYEDGDISELLNKNENTSTFTTSLISSSSTVAFTKRGEERTVRRLKSKTEELDVGYIIPLNVDKNIKNNSLKGVF